MSLSYKELQSALRTAKENGLTSIKLNSKQSVLQDEYDRITASTSGKLSKDTSNSNSASASTSSSSTRGSCYPFCSNTVSVTNNKAVPTTNYQVQELPAMSSSRAPSWLCKPETLYIIEGVEYLLHELEMQLKGQVCELACEFTAPAVVSNAVIDSIESYGSNRQPVLPPTTDDIAAATTASKTNDRKIAANAAPRLQTAARKDRASNARPAVPIVNSAKDKPKAKLTYSAEPASPYFIDTTKAARYTKGLGTTELQAVRNIEDAVKGARRGLAAVIDIAKGFHARQVQRALKAA